MTRNISRRSIVQSVGLVLAGAMGGIPATRLFAAPVQRVLKTPGGRSIAVTRWTPTRRRGTILFSHGALSSPAYYDGLILPWVQAGYEVWAPLHVDSTEHPERARFTGPQGWGARVEDMHVLARHVGAKTFVAAGHSYGGLVALTLGGASPATPPDFSGHLALETTSAVLAFSPPGPMSGLVEAGNYASLAVPALIQTGTMDLPFAPPGAPHDPESWHKHLMAYDEARPGGHRYALVMEDVDHYFGGAICNFEKPGPRRIAELATVAQISALFADAYGRGDKMARTRLDAQQTSSGPIVLTIK